MTTVVSGFASTSTKGNGNGNGSGNASGTEFLSVLPPAGEALKDWDKTKPHDQQPASIPQVFRDAMSVREHVYGQQGVPLEAEFDEDDARSWHWVVYASVAQTSSPPPAQALKSKPDSKAEAERRSSASATRLPVGTIRLIPPPHPPNRYLETDKHPDADPPEKVVVHGGKKYPEEPYIKLGRLAILDSYRSLGLSKLLINHALDYAAKNPESIRPPPSPTSLEHANQMGKAAEAAAMWQGLAMVHAQVSVERLWAKHGFTEELRNEDGQVEVPKEDHWVEEGIWHLGMWRRLKLDTSRL